VVRLMNKRNKERILVIVEDESESKKVKIMKHLFDVYGISNEHQIFSYRTNIYALYDAMFRDAEPLSKQTILLHLRELQRKRQKDSELEELLSGYYAEIILIFDLDPQVPRFTEEKIRKMVEHFTDSTDPDKGKLYINYPMSEAFYHMKSIPDDDYNNYTVGMEVINNEDKTKRYKSLVKQVNRYPYRNFAKTRAECSTVINQNLAKARLITGSQDFIPKDEAILESQLNKLRSESAVYVLCTCAFYIAEYNSSFIK
jgi:hypothetical protein